MVVTQVYGLTETAPFITICEPRPEHAALTPADRADQGGRASAHHVGRIARDRRRGKEVPQDGATIGEITVRGNVVMAGYYNDPEATVWRWGRLVPQRRRRGRPPGRLCSDTRSIEGRDHQRRREHPSVEVEGCRCATPPSRKRPSSGS
jgi:hypothetical protein